MKRLGEKDDFKKALILIIVALTGFWIVNNMPQVISAVNRLFEILFPFILGGCIAFVLNIPMNFFEKKILRIKGKKVPKKYRILSISFALVVILTIVGLIITLIVPELINIGKLLINNISENSENLNKWAKDLQINIEKYDSFFETENLDFESIKNEVINYIPKLFTVSVSFIGNIIGGITHFFIGLVFALYILFDKERLAIQIKKVIYAFFDKKKAYSLFFVGKTSNRIFKNFLTVQCLEASILGSLCIIGMFILRIPYAVPIGVLIGVTALIPIVGALIGLVIGMVLILSVAPFKVIPFVIFILVLQQVEGKLIYPRVVGSSVGLPGIWVLFAVTVGQSLLGILGMLIGVPIASILYTLLRRRVDKRLFDKKVNNIK